MAPRQKYSSRRSTGISNNPKQVLPKKKFVKRRSSNQSSIIEFTHRVMAEFDDSSSIMKGSEADKAADFANYFCSYAYLYHQKQVCTPILSSYISLLQEFIFII
jgi:hypothetical protein